jgi:hypothetical protein
MSEQRREYFRLEYPDLFRPVLILSDRNFNVLDVSEYGMRFQAKDLSDFVLGKTLGANLVFKNKDTLSCDGKIIRLNSVEVAVNLITPIPLHKIRAEHLNIIQNTRHTMNA